MKKILIIEDEQTVRTSLKELLEANDYLVFTASEGTKGIQLAKEIIPDLIICDVMMPKLSGHEVIEELKKEPDFAAVPFIFLTAKAEMSDLRSGMELGADDYITKPFKARDLLKAIKTRLDKYETIKSAQSPSDENAKEDKKTVLTENDRLFVNTRSKPQIIKVGEIICIKAEKEYSTVHLISGAKILVRKLMKEWEKQLPENIFLRIHRSTIINLNQVDKIEKWYGRSFIVILKNYDEKFVISQRYAGKIRSKFLS